MVASKRPATVVADGTDLNGAVVAGIVVAVGAVGAVVADGTGVVDEDSVLHSKLGLGGWQRAAIGFVVLLGWSVVGEAIVWLAADLEAQMVVGVMDVGLC